MRKDLFSSLVLLIVAGTYYFFSTDIQVSTLEDEVGPRGLPAALAILLAVLAAALGARSLALAPPAPSAAKGGGEDEAPWPRAMGMLALGALYIPVSTLLGYAPALFLLLLAVMLYEGMRPSRRMFAVAIGGAALFWFLFELVLGVRQPEGLLF